MISFEDNGDLGLAKTYIPIIALPYVVDTASSILSGLHQEFPDKNWKFSIQVSGDYAKLTDSVMDELGRKLHKNTKFYEIDGKRLFEIRGPSGGIVSSRIFYIVALAEGGNF